MPSELIQAIDDNNFSKAKQLIEQNPNNIIDLADESGIRPIHLVTDLSIHIKLSAAIKAELCSIALCLIKKGATLTSSYEGMQAIHYNASLLPAADKLKMVKDVSDVIVNLLYPNYKPMPQSKKLCDDTKNKNSVSLGQMLYCDVKNKGSVSPKQTPSYDIKSKASALRWTHWCQSLAETTVNNLLAGGVKIAKKLGVRINYF